MVNKKMLFISKPMNELSREFPYSELVNTLIPNRSEQEAFFKECRYTTLAEVKPETVLRYCVGFTQKRPHFSLFAFLLQVEKTFNQNQQELTQDFSNYADILTPNQLQTLYTGIPKTEVIPFLQTFFVFRIDAEVVYMQLLLKFRQQLSDENIFNKFLASLKSSSLTDTFEYHLECYAFQDMGEWLLVDVRFLWVVALRYLAENPQLYEQLVHKFYDWYKAVLERQKSYS